jgi:hypothetical protein
MLLIQIEYFFTRFDSKKNIFFNNVTFTTSPSWATYSIGEQLDACLD